MFDMATSQCLACCGGPRQRVDRWRHWMSCARTAPSVSTNTGRPWIVFYRLISCKTINFLPSAHLLSAGLAGGWTLATIHRLNEALRSLWFVRLR
jgi:hypothetical protein